LICDFIEEIYWKLFLRSESRDSDSSIFIDDIIIAKERRQKDFKTFLAVIIGIHS